IVTGASVHVLDVGFDVVVLAGEPVVRHAVERDGLRGRAAVVRGGVLPVAAAQDVLPVRGRLGVELIYAIVPVGGVIARSRGDAVVAVSPVDDVRAVAAADVVIS